MSIDSAGTRQARSAETGRRGSEFAELSRQARDAGHFGPRDGYYLRRAAAVLGLTATGWTALVLLGPTWWHLVTAVFLGVMFTQLGFLGHDVGHRQVFRTRRGAYVSGLLLANAAIGLSYGWWLDKHNRHHAHPNDLARDPDVSPGALVFDAEHSARRTGVGRRLTSLQAYLFFPMLLLEGLNLHLASARALRSGTLPARWLEGFLLALHATVYVTVVALVLPWPQALAFVAVQQASFGLYMGVSFAPNHKGMPTERPEDNWDYLRRQVITSRNVTGGPVVDRILGGLNYQIEHHLFPSMPSPALRHVQPLVRAFCAERDIPYTECGVLASYRQSLSHLNTVGRGGETRTAQSGQRNGTSTSSAPTRS